MGARGKVGGRVVGNEGRGKGGSEVRKEGEREGREKEGVKEESNEERKGIEKEKPSGA